MCRPLRDIRSYNLAVPSLLALLLVSGCGKTQTQQSARNGEISSESNAADSHTRLAGGDDMSDKASESKAHLCARLTPEQYRITQEKGTEAAFTGAFWNHHESGIYNCVVCGTELFNSKTKFDSGTGWPSFYAPEKESSLKTKADTSHGMIRTEVMCGKCDAHLGHVFDDGPRPTGLRYCINSAALKFAPAK